jgi:hypothetical protein
MAEIKNARNIFVGKLEEKRPLGRPKRGWEDDIRIDIGEKSERVWLGIIWLRTGAFGGLL